MVENCAYNGGNTAPPTMPIIKNAEPIFVNFPNFSMANGQIAGHITEFEKPNSIKHTIAVLPFVNIDNTTKIILKTVRNSIAFCCDMNFGMATILNT